MNIVVCVKQVPDTAVERTLKPGDGTLDRQTPDGLINELDEYAIEEGLRIAEAHGGEVTIFSMGPAKASESTDARGGVVPAMLAERLGVPQLTLASKVDIDGTSVSIRRMIDDGYAVVTGSLPAVVSVVEKINEPRYPSFKGIMAAKKKPVQTLTLADIGLAADAVGLAGSATQVADFAARPPRAAGVIVKDDGDGGAKVAAFLAERKFI